MSIEIFIGVLGLVIAAVGALASIAGLNDDGRARLSRWTRFAATRTYRIGYWIFILGGVVNGSLGVVLFGLHPSPPTRIDILVLIVFLINIAFGLSQMDKAIKNRATSVSPPT